MVLWCASLAAVAPEHNATTMAAVVAQCCRRRSSRIVSSRPTSWGEKAGSCLQLYNLFVMLEVVPDHFTVAFGDFGVPWSCLAKLRQTSRRLATIPFLDQLWTKVLPPLIICRGLHYVMWYDFPSILYLWWAFITFYQLSKAPHIASDLVSLHPRIPFVSIDLL